jgi:heterodisulfide reductase subunit C
MTLKITASDNTIRREIELACGVDLDACYECGKCSGGCSTGHHFDFTPRKIVQMARLGAEDKLLRMDALSICVSCRLCLDRCPSGIDIPRIIDFLREKAARQNVVPKRPPVDLFNRLFLEEIYRRGRVSELRLMARFKIRTRNFLEDTATGLRLLLKGKLDPLAAKVRQWGPIRPRFDFWSKKDRRDR